MNRSLAYSEVTDVDLDALITDIVAGKDHLGSRVSGHSYGQLEFVHKCTEYAGAWFESTQGQQHYGPCHKDHTEGCTVLLVQTPCGT